MNVINTIIGGAGGTSINNQDKTVTPTTSSQSITADAGYTGLGTVTVNAVTSSIDADIIPSNIKNGVDILGVVGTLSGVDIHYTTYLPTTTLNLKTFLETYDVRLHYKHSILFIYASRNNTAYSSATRTKLYIIPNCYNFARDYAAIKFTATGLNNTGWYNLMLQGTKGYDTHSTLSADATTGRLSSTVTSSTLAENGTMIATFEIPINPTNDADLSIVTDSWGS